MNPDEKVKYHSHSIQLLEPKRSCLTHVAQSPQNDFSYITKEPIPIEYWFYSISHYARILNVCPVKLSYYTTTPHEIVYKKICLNRPGSCCSPSEILTTSNTETPLDPPSSYRLFMVSQSVGPRTQIQYLSIPDYI